MAKHARELTPGWFVEHSPKQTVYNIITVADLKFLKTVTVEKFEQLLIDEIEFLAPANEAWVQGAKEYIHSHRDELYRYMKDLPAR